MNVEPSNEVAPETTDLEIQHKNPWLAVFFSLVIPGAGQLYCEKPQRSGVALAFSVFAVLVWITGDSTDVKALGLFWFFVVWTFSFLDAYFSAVEFNSGCDAAVDGRNPRVAVTLNLVLPSCGYFYLGQYFKGIVAYSAFVTAARIGSPPMFLLFTWVFLTGDVYRIARGQLRKALDQKRLDGQPIQPTPSLASSIPVGAIAYIGFINATRTIRGLKRGAFRRLPKWASDFYDLLEYVNFLKLLPILIAVAFVPKHFFDKLPLIIKGNSDLFLSPFKAMTTFASLAVVVSTHFGWSVEYRLMLAGLIVSALTAPIWTMIVILLFYVIFRPQLWFRRWFWRLWNDRWFNLYASLTALKRLQITLYLQGLFYYVIVFLFSLPAVWLACVLAIIPSFVLNNGVVAIAFTVAFAFLIVRPLAELFRACLNRPTEAAYAMDLQVIEHLTAKAKTYAIGIPPELLNRIHSELLSVLFHYKKQEGRLSHLSSGEFSAYLTERASACRVCSACFGLLQNSQSDLSLALKALLSNQPISRFTLKSGIGLAIARNAVVYPSQRLTRFAG